METCSLSRWDKGHERLHAIAPDPSTPAGLRASVALRKDGWERPSVLRAQPQAQQVALGAALRPILEGGTGVEELVVVQDLDVAWLKLQIQAEQVAGSKLIHHVQGLHLQLSEPWDAAVPLGSLDEAAGIDYAHGSLEPVNHRHPVVWPLARRDLPLPVHAEVLRQHLQKVRPAPQHFVVYRDRAAPAAQPALHGLPQAEQPHHVGRVCVEWLSCACGIHSVVGVARIQAHVAHVTKEMPRLVLRHRHAEVHA
eukprot:CAMPEP_0117664136 /NCGR_PEP_ID=MMETSP0804-20121206/9035_1 /TAXON_ID=1074897 /ORGANISM="Tetraselmis astigmatica, Strain CCMP880" /LENGTH=252 /DNA_ID=CAMNT_0005471301 /DNA_START=166 /DNA_END=924 /DNA_ORIENTATION=+